MKKKATKKMVGKKGSAAPGPTTMSVTATWGKPFQNSNAQVLTGRKGTGLLTYETKNSEGEMVIVLQSLGDLPSGFSLSPEAAAKLSFFLFRWAQANGSSAPLALSAWAFSGKGGDEGVWIAK